MESLLLLLYGKLRDFYWVCSVGVGQLIIFFVITSFTIIGYRLPLPFFIVLEVIFVIILPFIIFLTGRKFIVRARNYKNTVLEINHPSCSEYYVINFGPYLWRNPNFQYEQVPICLDIQDVILIDRRVGCWEIKIPVYIKITGGKLVRSIAYYDDLFRKIPGFTFMEYFEEAIDEALKKNLSDDLIKNWIDDGKKIPEARVLEKIDITNPFHEYIDVKLDVSDIEINWILPASK